MEEAWPKIKSQNKGPEHFHGNISRAVEVETWLNQWK